MGNAAKKPDLLDVSMELKMTARSLEKQSQKVEAMEKIEKKKIIEVSSHTFFPCFLCLLVLIRLLTRTTWIVRRFLRKMRLETRRRRWTWSASASRWAHWLPSWSPRTAPSRSLRPSPSPCPCSSAAWSRWTPLAYFLSCLNMYRSVQVSRNLRMCSSP